MIQRGESTWPGTGANTCTISVPPGCGKDPGGLEERQASLDRLVGHGLQLASSHAEPARTAGSRRRQGGQKPGVGPLSYEHTVLPRFPPPGVADPSLMPDLQDTLSRQNDSSAKRCRLVSVQGTGPFAWRSGFGNKPQPTGPTRLQGRKRAAPSTPAYGKTSR